jgi:hypothetical protein
MTASRHSGIELLEEAVDLLRRAPASAWAWYLAGAVPFFAAALIFWSKTTGVTTAPDPLPGALLLAFLFGWRQYSRSYFGAELYRKLAGAAPARHSLNALISSWCAGILRIPLLPLPFATVIALFRNVSILATRGESPTATFSRAGALASRGGGQNIALLTLAGASLMIWINVLTGLIALPLLFRVFTGQDTILTQNARALFNNTVTWSATILAWCIVDVVLTAFYALRVFYGESEETGADLLSAWRRAVLKTAAATAILMCLVPAVRAAEPAKLNTAIDQVLSEPAFQWRQPEAAPKEQNAFVRWTDNLFKSIRNSLRGLRRLWSDFVDWLKGQTPPPPKKGDVPPPAVSLRVLSWLVIVILAGALAALLIRAKRVPRSPDSAPLPAPPLAIDLEDPSLLASQLPESEWLALARDFLARGDYRMALRAYFLASLAFLASKELVAIGRSKSNLDYLGEVRRRARSLRGLDALFAAEILTFESAWYGLHDVGDSEVRGFAETFERMRSMIPA